MVMTELIISLGVAILLMILILSYSAFSNENWKKPVAKVRIPVDSRNLGRIREEEDNEDDATSGDLDGKLFWLLTLTVSIFLLIRHL